MKDDPPITVESGLVIFISKTPAEGEKVTRSFSNFISEPVLL